MKNEEKLTELAAKPVSEYTAEDKKAIFSISDEMGVAFNPRPRCKNCYFDQVILLIGMLRAKDSTCSYKLKHGIDMIWKGLRINNETLTDELARMMLEQGIPELLFEVIA